MEKILFSFTSSNGNWIEISSVLESSINSTYTESNLDYYYKMTCYNSSTQTYIYNDTLTFRDNDNFFRLNIDYEIGSTFDYTSITLNVDVLNNVVKPRLTFGLYDSDDIYNIALTEVPLNFVNTELTYRDYTLFNEVARLNNYQNGYQSGVSNSHVITDVFDLMVEGSEPVIHLLSQEIAPDTTIGAIALIPLSFAVVAFLIKGLIL